MRMDSLVMVILYQFNHADDLHFMIIILHVIDCLSTQILMNVTSTCQCVNLTHTVTILLGATSAFVTLAILEMVSSTALVSLYRAYLTAVIIHWIMFQISMNVNLTLMTVMRMLSVLIPLVASTVTVPLGTLDLGQNAVSVHIVKMIYRVLVCNMAIVIMTSRRPAPPAPN